MNIMNDLVISHTCYLKPDMTIVKDKTITIKDGRISGIFDGDEICEGIQRIEGEHLLWMPGLIDGHLHTSQQLLKGRLLDEKPVIWKRVNVPFEASLNEQAARTSAELAALEMILDGTTGFVDAGGKYAEIFAEVYEEAGLRGRVSVMTNDNPHFPPSLRSFTPKDGVERLRKMARSLNGRIRPIYSVTTPTAVSEEMLREVFEAAAEDHVPVETHMNEYASEVTDFIEAYGKRPFIWMEEENLLDAPMTAAHCIFLSENEMDILSKHQICAVHCPFSNCGKGAPATHRILHRNIPVALGTDGAGHGGLDLFREMRLLRSVIQLTAGVESADSTVLPAESILRIATLGGAKAMHEDDIGEIRPGAKADIIAVDTNSPNLWPTQNLVHSLVESASGQDVRHMIVDGKIIMKDREIPGMDVDRIQYEARELFKENPSLIGW